MEIIAELSDYMKDEIKGIKKCIEMAVEYKHEDKELADIFYNMAKFRKTHLDNIHIWMVKRIEKEKKERIQPVPEYMEKMWKKKHKELVDSLLDSEVILSSYQKM